MSWQYGQLVVLHDIKKMPRDETLIVDKHEWEPSSLKTVSTGGTFNEASTLEAGEVQGPIAPRSWLPQWNFCSRTGDPEIEETITRKLEDCHNGYPRLAAFLSSEQNFTLYRGFDYLHSRVLLDLQHELVVLEKKLKNVDDDAIYMNRPDLLQSRAVDLHFARTEGIEETRQSIISEIRRKLMEYDEVLIKARELAAFQRPSNRNYRSVRTWIRNLRPLVVDEEAFIKHKEDILCLRHGREYAGFDGLVESLLRKIECPLVRRLFCARDLRGKTDDPAVFYYSPSRVEAFVNLIITSIIFVLLVLPIVAMYRLTSFGTTASTFDAVGVLIVFTLLFSAAMSLTTKASRHELFAASAAYCAVLVVFISNFGGATGPGGR